MKGYKEPIELSNRIRSPTNQVKESYTLLRCLWVVDHSPFASLAGYESVYGPCNFNAKDIKPRIVQLRFFSLNMDPTLRPVFHNYW